MIDLETLTIEKTHTALKNRDFSVRDLVEAYSANIHSKNLELNAVLGMYTDIDEQIRLAEEAFTAGTDTLLTGIPFAIKDNILVYGQTATAGSKILEKYTATYDAHVIELLKKERAILLSRTNMDEFAMGGSTENSAYGVVHNPCDTSRVAGGSSGGSAASVAAHMSLVSLGTDTGGSIRQPASYCGIVGLKTTYGSVSRSGAMAMGSSLDQIGPFGKTVRDVEIVFNTISKFDAKDATSVEMSKRAEIARIRPVKKIGVPYEFVRREGVDSEVLANFEKTVSDLEKSGYEIVPISMPNLHYALSVYYVLVPAEVSSNMARYDGIRYGMSIQGNTGVESYSKTRAQGLGREVRRRIMLGTYVLSHGYYDAYYNKALSVRELIRQEFISQFNTVDIILTPTSPIPAFKIGEKSEDPLAMYLADIFTVPANIAGVPAMSVPTGKNSIGLPLSVQCTAPHFCEEMLFEIGKKIESNI